MDDIARLAEVGRGTVSRVLNNHPSVSDATRARVLAVIEQLNYSPNFSARHMRTETSNLVGFVTDEVITTPYAVDMIRGAQEVLWKHGKILLVFSAGYDSETTRSSVEVLEQRRVEGIVYAAMFHRAVVLPQQMPKIPIVLANCFAKDRSLPSVVPDEASGGYNATKALLEQGHRRIAFINLGPNMGEPAHISMPPLPAALGRLAGYKKALAQYDVPYDESLVCYTHQTPQVSYHLTRSLIQLKNPPTAIFCGNDRTALSCYNGLTSLGLRIPSDVAVIGFDNQTDIAEGLYPTLTTVQLPHYEMGRWAVEYLLSRTEPEEPPIQHKLECVLVERQSV
ncbi:MAG: LacI family DNA-binding transcriptional regulator [Chloroflexi bacterium]|nr:LacI family DNA-binding transcriptional regulator [Chloroflexota bacterium]